MSLDTNVTVEDELDKKSRADWFYCFLCDREGKNPNIPCEPKENDSSFVAHLAAVHYVRDEPGGTAKITGRSESTK